MIVDPEPAAELLRSGATVAYPTETVYGLAADARNEQAIDRLRHLKGRDPDAGLSVLIDAVERLEDWVPRVPQVARRLAERYWPGPLTLVIPVASDRLADVSTAYGVGFRCSSHPVASALARSTGFPLIATSCNRSGAAPCVTAAEVEAGFGAALPVVVGAPAGGGLPSTVVAVSAEGELELLRSGALPFDEIQRGGLA